jgi:DmsE family decaheme c-type cytochrome
MLSTRLNAAAVGLGSKNLVWCSSKSTEITSTIRWIALLRSGLIYFILLNCVLPARAEEHKFIGENNSPVLAASSPTKVAELARGHQLSNDGLPAQADFAQSTDAERPKIVSQTENKKPHHSQFDAPVFTALREYAEKIGVDQPKSNSAPRLRIAEADNALDALREFLQRRANPSSTPSSPPIDVKRTAPQRDRVVIDATLVGAKTCLTCHTGQAETFGKTLMGRIAKTQPGKFDCENCHGPGSAHVQGVGCAACHGDAGITNRPGTPSLVGQDPQYLAAAMKAYIAGQRKHDLMRAMLSGVGQAELNNIAYYYARKIPARAQTPAVGDASAGNTASAVCAGCHGEQGVSASPMWPSLAGQDAQYLAVALKAYKDGSRHKAIDCAGCHGEAGNSKKPGMPSLVGQDPQYLVAAMKAYITGQRKHDLMKVIISGAGEAELNNIALYYARQVPARAQTPAVGDPSAGKAASAACAGCHGAEGVSANPMWPSLAGQDARYLAVALKAYKNGSRNDATMKGFVAALDETTIDNIASYYASLRPAQRSPTNGASNGSKHDPVVTVGKALFASLDERTINNLASYYASLHPVQPSSANGAGNGSARPIPILVSKAAPTDGRSVGGINSFRSNDPSRTAQENNAVCLTCHERGDRTYWSGSTHESRDVACTNCHTVMRNVSIKHQLKTAFEPDTCFQCHKDRRAQMFRSSHMPLREGKMVCSDCHNPHGSTTSGLLKTASINDTCYKCHAEKRGPFLFEHTPVRDNCLNCHDAHGSTNEYLLKVSRPRLCAECHGFGHGLTSGPLAVQTIGRQCQNCHTKVHGTNSPAGALLHR